MPLASLISPPIPQAHWEDTISGGTGESPVVTLLVNVKGLLSSRTGLPTGHQMALLCSHFQIDAE